MEKVLEDKSALMKEQMKDVPSEQIRRVIHEMSELLARAEPEFEHLEQVVGREPPSAERDRLFQGFEVIKKMVDLGHTVINAGLGELTNRGEQL
jgi:hypothetical protein